MASEMADEDVTTSGKTSAVKRLAYEALYVPDVLLAYSEQHSEVLVQWLPMAGTLAGKTCRGA